MNDYTAAVIRLENSYASMQIARKRVADEVKAEFQRAIRDEVARRQYEIEHEFAKDLRLESERGLPGSVIRSEVLRTQDWNRWKKWRDMADIEPESIVRRNAKADRAEEERRASLLFEWIDGVLHVYRNVVTKAKLPHVVKYPMYNTRGTYVPWFIDEIPLLAWLTGDRSEGIKTAQAASAEVKRAFEAGELTKSTHPYDYVYSLDSEEQTEYLEREDEKFKAANPWLDEYTKETA